LKISPLAALGKQRKRERRIQENTEKETSPCGGIKGKGIAVVKNKI